jgi:hypothetical protein
MPALRKAALLGARGQSMTSIGISGSVDMLCVR